MNPESLDSSIQGALSALFPPFEATAPIVLCQLFRTIEERYHGDALHCLLDFLIPSKHLLESVQQAACASYSDVIFRCEGWPLCLHDKTVIHLAPLNPLLLRPGDFYLQVEPFGEQAARIVLKSLLEEGCREVEETPIPEVSYPCMFTDEWLQEVNEGRHGTPLSRCLLSTDQGVIKLPWAKIAVPEFLDKPKTTPASFPVTHEAPPEPRKVSTPSHYNSSTLPMEAMILPTRDRISVSLRLVEHSSKLVKMERERPAPKTCPKPSIKPVGWVSPNTWDSRNYCEIEGDYVDLVDLDKDKEALGKLDSHANPPAPVFFKPVRPPPPVPMGNGAPCGHTHGYAEEPCTPCSQRKLSYELSDQDLKCRYRDSYMAALANPVAFEKGSVELLAALEEVGLHEQGEFGSKGPISAQGNELGPCGHHYNASEPNNEPDPHKSYCETAANIASHLKDPPVTFKSKKLSRAPRGEDKLTSAQCHKASLPSHEGRRDSKRRSVSDDSNPVLEKCDGNLRPHHKEKHKAKLRSLSTVSESAKGSPILYKLSNRSLSDVCPEMIPNITHHNKHTVFDLVLSRQERHQPPTKGKADLPYIADGSCPKLQKSKVDKPSPPQVRLPSHNLEAAFSPPSQEAAFRSLLGLLQLGIMCLPGGRDKTGRAVVEVHCDRGEWVSPLASAQDLCKLLIYLHSIPRKEVRDLGMTLVIDARKRLPPPHLYKALLLVQEQALHAVHCAVMLVDKDACSRPERQPGLQMDVVTSLKALNKMVDVPQLTSDLSGTFPYSHADWLQFHQRLVSFVADLQGADSLLQRAIKKVNGSKIMDTAQDVQLCIQEQRTLMKEVLQDARLVTLQREGGAVLARIRRELQFQPSEDYRDAVGTVTGLYNQVEEKLHTLVMRSNESLQQLDYLFKLREMEGKINLAGIWFNAEGEQTLKDSNTTDDAPAGTERALQQLDSFLLEAKDKRRQALTLVMEAETIVGMSASSPATDVFRTVVSTFKSNMDDLLLRAEQRRKELDKLVQLYRFCEQATALAKECSLHLEQVEKGCYLTEASRSALKYEDRFAGEFSASHFQAVKARARAVGSGASGVLRSWNAAWIQCQKVRQRLGERHNKNGSDKKQNQRATAVASQRNSGVQKRGEEEEEEEEEERSEGGQSGRFVVQKSPSSTEEVDYSERDVEKGGGSAIEESTGVVPSHPHLKPDLKAIAAGDCERAAGDVQRTAVQPQNGEHVLKSKWRQREHHSEMDLTRVESSGEELLLHQTLGRSLSEGSCASPCLTPLSGSTPLSAKLNHCQVTAQSSQSIENSPVSRNESFCSGNSRCELNTDRKAEERDSIQSSVSSQSPNDSSRQESFNVIDTPTEQSGSYILKLQRIIDELLSTEREYVRALGYIREHYFVELERADVPQDLRGQRGSIFGNLEKLHDFHRHHFLKELESCVREPFRVGRCFLRHRESFALYALYSKNKPRSDSLLINHGQGFFKRKQLELGDKMDLWSYLLKPVQRISKYSLLLQDVVGECSPGQSREMAEVQAALQVVNFQLRHGNNLLAMDDIHHCDVNLKEQGHLIRQDEFLVTFRKKKCFRHIFLFQELVLFSKTKKTDVGNDMYIYKQSFKMSDIGLTHNSGDSGLCFEIWFRRRKSQDTYTLQAACREVKEAWTKDLERILWEQALQNREVRMQERVFMGIGNKPFMDIQPSDAAINSRAVNYVLAHGGTPALRPDSISSERSLTSSSSSGIGSLSSLGYLCGPKQSRGERSSGGYVAPPGVMEEDDLDQESGSHHLLMDSSESSGESVSGFSSSGLSCHSALGGEMEDAPSVAVKEAAQAHPTEAPAHLNKPNGATPPPVAPKPKSLCPTKNLSGGKLRHGNNLLAMDDIHHCDVQSPGKSTDV